MEPEGQRILNEEGPDVFSLRSGTLNSTVHWLYSIKFQIPSLAKRWPKESSLVKVVLYSIQIPGGN